jgi:hypothetical protein
MIAACTLQRMPPMPIDNASKLMSHPVQHYTRSIGQNDAIEQRDDAHNEGGFRRTRSAASL